MAGAPDNNSITGGYLSMHTPNAFQGGIRTSLEHTHFIYDHSFEGGVIRTWYIEPQPLLEPYPLTLTPPKVNAGRESMLSGLVTPREAPAVCVCVGLRWSRVFAFFVPPPLPLAGGGELVGLADNSRVAQENKECYTFFRR